MGESERATIIGTDEAGLGPLLGPLVIGGVRMQVPEKLRNGSIWAALAPLVSMDHREKKTKIVVCDSKLLHSSAKGVGPLEEALLPCLAVAGGCVPTTFRELWRGHCAVPERVLSDYPWYADADLELPLMGMREKIEIRADKLRAALDSAKINLESVVALPILVGEFNKMLLAHRSKSDVDAAGMYAAMSKLIRPDDAQVQAVCDRLGARMGYRPGIEAHLRTTGIEKLSESNTLSAYRVRLGEDCLLNLAFMVNADETRFEVALASMCAKYLRELCMELFNRWFSQHLSDLKPTKGYTTDGRRWLEDTAELRTALDLPSELVVRRR